MNNTSGIVNRPVSIVTGGAGGIGRGCSDWFGSRGHEVRILDRVLGHDCCDPSSVASSLTDLETVTNLVHAVGSVGSGGFEEITLSEWHRVLDDNLTSALVVVQSVLPLMAAGSSIVLFSSVNGRHGGNQLSGAAYATAKSGLIGLTRHLAKDLARRQIRVNAVAPGPVATPMLERLPMSTVDELLDQMPLRRLTTVDEIAGTVGWLCSPHAASVTGAVIDINGGLWMG